MKLSEVIQNLVGLQTEGDHWDFKEMWHSNKADLIHDIICMANNQIGRDAYIIIGVSDSKSADGVKIKGVSDANRKDQQHLIDFFRDKKFAGGVRPEVYLQTLNLFDDNGAEQPVDVIIIKHTAKTPYFLTENFRDRDREVRAGYIYTRIGDTNTAIDSFADLDKIEYLWRKRFGIDMTAMDRLLLLLDSPDDWVGDLNNSDFKYHSIYPEFQIHIRDIEEDDDRENDIVRNIADHNMDKSCTVSEVVITYHSTILYTKRVLYLDGYRHLIPFPSTDSVYIGGFHELEGSLTYVYFDLSAVMGKLFLCFAKVEHNWYNEKWRRNPGVAFLVFDSDEDHKAFNAFAYEHLDDVLKEYQSALAEKGYHETQKTAEYYYFGWSKANEIKSQYLYDQYRGLSYRRLVEYLPDAKYLLTDDGGNADAD